MKVISNIMTATGIFLFLLFASGADLNELETTMVGLGGAAVLLLVGMAIANAEEKHRSREERRKIERGMGKGFTAAGLLISAVATAAIFSAASAMQARAEAEPETETFYIEIHSEKDVIDIDEAPPIRTEPEMEAEPTAAEEVKTADAPEEETAQAAGFTYLEVLPLTYEEQRLLYDLWTGAGYDYAFALALADKETGGTFNKTAINHNTHDYGLFQLNRKSWYKTFKKMFGISSMEEMLDYERNIRGAIYVYGDCVSRYGETERAIVAYNMGFAKYNSTDYSRAVMGKHQKWQNALEAAKGM